MTKGNKFVTGLIAGAVVGAIAGLLVAPKPGKETRQIVVTRAEELRSKAGDYVTTLRQKVRKGSTVEIEESSNDHVGASN